MYSSRSTRSRSADGRSRYSTYRCDTDRALRAIDRLRDAHSNKSTADELEAAVRAGSIPDVTFKKHSKWCNTAGSYSAGVDPAREAAWSMYGFVPERLESEDGKSDAAMKQLMSEYRQRLSS